MFPGSILEDAVIELGLQEEVDLPSINFSSKVQISLSE
jgi:hypothetical protein